jgi:predicted ATP-grasp superfamily ATP-dependent carboligase
MELPDEALPPAVVLNMHYTGLALSRALHSMGLRVFGLSSDPALVGNVSNTIEFRLCPDTEQSPEECIEYLRALATELGQRPLLLATRDHDVHMIRTYRSALEESFILAMPDNDVLGRILDKRVLYSIAERIGVPCPRSFWIRDPAEMQRALTEIPIPCIAKPVSASDWRKPAIWEAVGRRKAVIFHDRQELENFYSSIYHIEPALCIQEYVPGDDTELVIVGAYVNAHSGARAVYTARKLLQLPPLAGTGVAVRSCAVPEIVEPSLRLLDHLQYVGPAEIEYKRDRESGQFKLIEINTRFWDQHALGAACGVDLVKALIEDVVFGQPRKRAADGSTVTWISEDGFLVSFLGSVTDRAQKGKAHRAAWRGRKVYAIWSWKDPRPALRVAAALIRRFAAGGLRAVRRRMRFNVKAAGA